MFGAQETATIVLHVPPARPREADVGDAHCDLPSECELQQYHWYTEYLAGSRRPILVLLPACWRMAEQRLHETFGPRPICWYEDTAELPAEAVDRRQLWIVSAQQAPIIDWQAADAAARRRDLDVLLFGPRTSRSQAHYSESVVVDHDGLVLRFRRHYFDSSAFAAKWAGPPGFMAIPAKHATPVVNHLISCGWGMESIGALALSFTLGWADSPCVLGAGRSAQPTDAPGVEHAANDLDSSSRSVAQQSSEAEMDDAAAAEDDPTYLLLKRSLDLLASALGLAILSPLLLATALAIKLTSRGPVLFGHRRQGIGGREFTCWKFRSMRVGADAMQAKLRALNEVDGPQFKIKADPRITPIGAFLRQSNIDELPQLINVLLGQMSLVGPRPSPDRENQLCPAWRRARLSVKPGITGLWQVLRRRDDAAESPSPLGSKSRRGDRGVGVRATGNSDFQEWIYYDVEYAKHRSLWLDIRILLYTPVAILAPTRASALARKLQKFGICAYSPRICLSSEELLPQTTAQSLSNAHAHSSPVGKGSGLSSTLEENEC